MMSRPRIEIIRNPRAIDVEDVFSGKVGYVIIGFGAALAVFQDFLLRTEPWRLGWRMFLCLLGGTFLLVAGATVNSRILYGGGRTLLSLGLGHLCYLWGCAAIGILAGTIRGDIGAIMLLLLFCLGFLITYWQSSRRQEKNVH